MPVESNTTEAFHGKPATLRAATLSIVIHILLSMLALLFLFNSSPKSGDGESLRAGEIVLAIRDPQQKTEYFDSEDTPVVTSASQSAAAFPKTLPQDFDFIPNETINLPGLTTGQTSAAANDLTGNTTGAGLDGPHELTAEDLKLIEADRKLIASRQPKGPPTTISFFGDGKLTGRKFVFLIDRSNSMGQQGLDVLQQARGELIQAINQLESHHQFQIIAYHNSTATIARRELLDATAANKQLVPGFIDNLVAYGGTNHDGGLYSALLYDPDVIVMMTDGGRPHLHDGQLSSITRSATGTQIHTIEFGAGASQESAEFLSKLANLNSGTYRYIDVRQWR